MNIPLFVYLFICQWMLRFLCLLALVNSVAMNMCIQISIGVPAFSYFEIPEVELLDSIG